MLETLRMVRGAVADKPIVQALTNFCINGGRVQGSNSRLTIDAPIPIEGSFAVSADHFIKAIDQCTAEVEIAVVDDSLWIKEGRLRIKLPRLQTDAFPLTQPDPPDWEPESPMLPVARALMPFVATDANQVWPMGIWMSDDGWAFATNNVCILRCPCDFLKGTAHSLNVPGAAVEELLRIGREPIKYGVSDNSITFYYDDGAWLKTQLIDRAWPVDQVQMLYKTWPKKMRPVPDGLAAAVDSVMPFCENAKFPVIVLGDDMVATEDGASRAEVSGFKGIESVRFNGSMIQLALQSAETLQLGDRSYFTTAEGGRGIIMALRT